MSVPEFPANAVGAPCRDVDPELMFPKKDATHRRTDAAKNVCRNDCPHFDDCLAYALRNRVEGIWAATTEKERAAIRIKRGIEAAPMSFASGPTNTTIVKRMHKRGRSVADIAAHLGVTFEAVRLIIRADEERRASEGRPPRPDPKMPVVCRGCGRKMLQVSYRKHLRSHCAGRAAAS